MDVATCFRSFARLFHEPLLLVDRSGTILAVNESAAGLCAAPGGTLAGLFADPGRVERFLGQCARMSHPVPGTLEWATGPTAGTMQKLEGMRFHAPGHPHGVYVMLKLRPAEETTAFAALNTTIDRLNAEIREWQRVDAERQLLNDELSRTIRSLELANAAKDEFLGLVSHELRTPVTVVLGSADHLLRRHHLLSPQDLEETLEEITRESYRMMHLVENLLRLARAERIETVETEPVLLDRIVKDTVREFEAANEGRTITLDLPLQSVIVDGVGLYFEQLLRNLLMNAHKYSPLEHPIDVHLRVADGLADVAIADRGPGLTGEDRERVFEPFYRGQEAQKRATGFGIGLTVCKRLAEAMGGAMRFEDRPGGGSIFAFSVPLAPQEEL